MFNLFVLHETGTIGLYNDKAFDAMSDLEKDLISNRYTGSFEFCSNRLEYVREQFPDYTVEQINL